MDQAHKEVANVSAMQRLVEEGVFPMHDGPFKSLLTDVVIQRRLGDSQKQSQFWPVVEQVGDGLTYT